MLDHDVDQLLTTPTQPNHGVIMTHVASYSLHTYVVDVRRYFHGIIMYAGYILTT